MGTTELYIGIILEMIITFIMGLIVGIRICYKPESKLNITKK